MVLLPLPEVAVHSGSWLPWAARGHLPAPGRVTQCQQRRQEDCSANWQTELLIFPQVLMCCRKRDFQLFSPFVIFCGVVTLV